MKPTRCGAAVSVCACATMCACIMALTSCGKSDDPVPTSEEAPKVVTTMRARAEERQAVERVPGTVRSSLEATIEAKISGRIKSIRVQEGSAVKEGDVLLEISANEMHARLEQALAAERQAKSDLERFKRLMPTGAVTKQEFESVETKARVAEATVVEARTLAEYTTIRAPFAGIVARKLSEAGDQATPGKPLLLVERSDLFRLEADIPESASSYVKLGDSMRVQIADLAIELNARVSEISPTTDSATRTRRVKLDLDSHDLVRSGHYGYVLVPMQRRASIVVPEEAVLERGQLEVAFVIQAETARLRLIRTGKRSGGQVEVVSGIRDGELVITSDLRSIKDGDRVKEGA